MFQDIQNCTSRYIQSACNNVSSSLGIYWPAVTWSDLRKPLYSGVAAALYTLLTLSSQSMPGNVTAQANLWVQMYGGQTNTFSDVASQASTVGKTIRFHRHQDSTDNGMCVSRFPCCNAIIQKINKASQNYVLILRQYSMPQFLSDCNTIKLLFTRIS